MHSVFFFVSVPKLKVSCSYLVITNMQMDNGEWETSKFVESKAYEVQWKQAAWNGWMFQINFSGFFIHSSNELRELGLKALLVIINSEKTQNKTTNKPKTKTKPTTKQDPFRFHLLVLMPHPHANILTSNPSHILAYLSPTVPFNFPLQFSPPIFALVTRIRTRHKARRSTH